MYVNKKHLKWLMVAALMPMSQSLAAQSVSELTRYYAHQDNKHPESCWRENKFEKSVYFGPLLSSTDGTVAEKNNLLGFDLGLKFSGIWGYSCRKAQFEMNGYMEIKTGLTPYDKEEGGFLLGEPQTDYAALVAIAPGVRVGCLSIACGPYVGYSAFANVWEGEVVECLTDPDVGGLDFGLRAGLALTFKRFELGVYYDKSFVDFDEQFKKNEIMLNFGYKF